MLGYKEAYPAMRGHSRRVWEMATNGTILATASTEGSVCTWIMETGYRLDVYNIPGEGLAMSKTQLFVSTAESIATLFELETKQAKRKYEACDNLIELGDTHAMTVNREHQVLLWDLRSPTEVQIWSGHKGTVSSVTLSHDIHRIAYTTRHGEIMVMDTRQTRPLLNCTFHRRVARTYGYYKVSPDCTEICIGGQRGGYVVDLASLCIKKQLRIPWEVVDIVTSEYMVTWRTLFSRKMWCMNTGQLMFSDPSSVCMTMVGDRIITADNEVRVFDTWNISDAMLTLGGNKRIGGAGPIMQKVFGFLA